MTMRRIKHICFAMALLITLGACGAGAGEVPAPTRTVPPSATVIPSPTATATATATATPQPTARPTPTQVPQQPRIPTAPVAHGKALLVSLSHQWLYAYEDGRPVFDNAVVTGMAELPTPTGWFSVQTRQRDVTMVSPWPEGSPYHYLPTHVNYAMLFASGGYYLHDAWWHVKLGPGANVPHQLPDGRWESGTHGCIGMSIADAKRLFDWSSIGIPVVVVPGRTERTRE